MVDEVYTTMYNYMKMIEGQLHDERLHEVFNMLATELINFVALRLRMTSQKEAQKTDIACFVRMLTRLNEV